MTLIFDSGAFIALERNDRAMWRRVKAAERASDVPVTHGGVVAQVWRGGGRQALLARALQAVEVVGLDEDLGRRAGTLAAKAGSVDVIDAALAAMARHGDQLLTSDPHDLAALIDVGRQRVDIIKT